MPESRSYQDELNYLEKLNDYSWKIKKGFVPNMKVNQFQNYYKCIKFMYFIY